MNRTFGAITLATALLMSWEAPAQRSALAPLPIPADTQPISAEVARLVPLWWSSQFFGTQAPLPVGCVPQLGVDIQLYYSPSANAVFIGDQNVDYSALANPMQLNRPRTMDDDQTDDSGGQNSSILDTNSLWLQITNVSQGVAFVNLNNATNQVYAILSTTDLLAGWSVETEVWPTNQAVMPFSVPTLDRQTLFLRAMDWTGVDRDGDGIPDWWIWTYFGDLSETATNIDTLGNTLLYDYTNNLDPNVIQFSLLVTNQFVNTDSAPLQVILAGGVPNYCAVLVNNTNTSAANWQPYSGPGLAINLGSTDGVYNVKFGLRGRPGNATQTWQDAQFIRDTAPLLLTLTNMGSCTGARPFIDPAGYANKALLSLTLQIVDANGVTNSIDGVVADHTVNPFNMLQTTNWFECVDVALAQGTNTVTLTGVDLAGNPALLGFNYVFDTNGDVTPPVIAMIWPQDSMQVSGNSITLRGTLDDDTATVSALFVDTNGVTNIVSGLVERSGEFWVQNLPLNPGTNTVLVTATDAAGNSSTTNLNLLQPGKTLTMDQPTSGQLNYVTVNVTGTISEPDYVVWVNGVRGVNTGYNTWSANNVPVTSGGTGCFDITAYPPGEAPTGNSWINYGVQQLAYPNLTSSNAIHAHYDLDRQPVVYMQSLLWGYNYVQTNGSTIFTYSESSDWARQTGGSFVTRAHTDDLSWPAGTQTMVDTKTWPPDSGLLPSLPGREVIDYYDADGVLFYEATNSVLPPQPAVQHGAVSGAPDVCWGFPYNLTADNVIKLFTGKAVRGTQALFILSADLSHEIVNLCATEPFLPLTTQISSLAITLETFGRLYPDGLAGKVLAYGQNPTITPHAPANLAGAGPPSVSPHPLIHEVEYPALMNTNLDRTKLGVGEWVDLSGPPVGTKWTTTAGGVKRSLGFTKFTAPSNAPPRGVTATVKAQWRNERPQQVSFTVVPPNGIDHAVIVATNNVGNNFRDPSLGETGAAMRLDVFIAPTDVSFYRVQIMEVGQDASNIKGYYTQWTPQELRHIPNGWTLLTTANRWTDVCGKNPDPNTPIPWSIGSYTWEIPARWKLVDDTTTNTMTGWNQVISMLDTAGTIRIDKYEHWVQRTTNNIITTH